MKSKNRLGVVLAVFVAGVLVFGSLLTGSVQGATFPEKGRPITVIVPYPPGGSTDTTGRLLAPMLAKELGTPVEVLNKPGAGGQVGTTALSMSRPDGYTFGYIVMPTVVTTYLDPSRQAAFSRKSFDLLALFNYDPTVMAVKSSSPYKTLKDLIDAAKANPGKIKTTTSGILSDDHMTSLMTEKAAGVKFAIVHFDGGNPGKNAVLGGHVDVFCGNVSEVKSFVSSGEMRVLAVLDRQRNKFFPDVMTAEEQGYKLYNGNYLGLLMPAGAPKEVRDVLSDALKKVITSDEFGMRLDKIGLTVLYMGPPAFETFWTEYEAQAKKWLEWAKDTN